MPTFRWDPQLWLGPAPKVAYNPNRCLYKFRWFGDYSGGQLTNFGTHYLDVIQWALNQEAPRGVFAAGGKYAIADNREIPDTMEVIWEYPGTLVTLSQFNASQLITQRENVARLVRENLARRAARFNITLDDVSLTVSSTMMHAVTKNGIND